MTRFNKSAWLLLREKGHGLGNRTYFLLGIYNKLSQAEHAKTQYEKDNEHDIDLYPVKIKEVALSDVAQPVVLFEYFY